MSFIVAIDGPAGSGKGTLTTQISKLTDLINIDTGATYRCVTLAAIRRGYTLEDEEKIINLLDEINIELKKVDGEDKFFLDSEDVSKKIREKEVRAQMVRIQRELAKGKNVIMEGRDIGTYVFPNADVKIYLDATLEVRAARRVRQNKEKNIDMSYEEVYENMKKRDYNDMHGKEIGALKKAEDAIYLDCSDMSVEEMTQTVLKIIEEKRNK